MRRTKEEMYPIVKLFRAYSGLKKDFCQEHKLSSDTLDYWRSKYRKSQKAGRTKEGNFLEIVQNTPEPSLPLGYTLHLSTGHKLDLPMGTPPSVLTALVKQLV